MQRHVRQSTQNATNPKNQMSSLPASEAAVPRQPRLQMVYGSIIVEIKPFRALENVQQILYYRNRENRANQWTQNER